MSDKIYFRMVNGEVVSFSDLTGLPHPQADNEELIRQAKIAMEVDSNIEDYEVRGEK